MAETRLLYSVLILLTAGQQGLTNTAGKYTLFVKGRFSSILCNCSTFLLTAVEMVSLGLESFLDSFGTLADSSSVVVDILLKG
jgi:hypothetical protein